MKRSVFKRQHLGRMLIWMMIIVCAICVYEVLGRRTVIPLTFETKQFCTNLVVTCVEDNAYPGLVVLGYNKKVFITALDLEETGVINVQMVNCMSNAVAMKCVAGEMWDVDLPRCVYPGERCMMSIWTKESSGDSRSSADNPDVELYDENSGRLLCALYVKRGCGRDRPECR